MNTKQALQCAFDGSMLYDSELDMIAIWDEDRGIWRSDAGQILQYQPFRHPQRYEIYLKKYSETKCNDSVTVTANQRIDGIQAEIDKMQKVITHNANELARHIELIRGIIDNASRLAELTGHGVGRK